MDIPDVRYARTGGVSIAYQSVGEGPALFYAPHLCTIEALWSRTPGRSSIASWNVCS